MSSDTVMIELESLQAKYVERVRQRAEKGLRSLIHKEFLCRLGREMSSMKGMHFHDRSARMREARRRVGIQPDEVYGGELSAEALFAINTSGDAERYLNGTDERMAGGTIFGGLGALRIGASQIARVIAESNASVKKSVRLLRAEEAAERECASEANDSGQAEDLLKQLLSNRFRRRILGRRPESV